MKINIFGNKNSQNSLAKKVRFQLKAAENKSMETKAYITLWILSGSLNVDGTENHVINTNITHVLRVFATDRYNHENDVYKCWDLETLGISEKELSCYDNYLNSIKKNWNGRYEAEFPFKENHPVIQDHFTLCKRRLSNSFTHLKRNPELLK